MPAQPNAQNLPTACVLCSHNCGLRVDVVDGRIDAVRADDTSPITKGYSCHKGYSIGRYVHHPQRVERPLRRRSDGSFEPISWDVAIAEIGARLKALRAAHGPKSLAIAGIGGQGNHLDGPYASAFIKGYGSPWIFNALAQEKTQHSLVDGWIFNAPGTVYLHADAEHSAHVLVLGTNPVISHRGMAPTRLFNAVAKDPERTFTVMDPRKTETARRADAHLAVRPGTDAQAMMAIIKIVLEEDLGDPAYMARTDGIGALKTALADTSLEQLSSVCELSVDALQAEARRFARAKSASIFWDLGVEQCRYSTLLSYLMRVLLVLTGNIGNPGGNGFLSTFLPDPGARRRRQPVAPESGIPAIPIFSQLGYFSPNLMAEEILNERPDRIRAVIVEGSNPMIQYADTHRVEAALRALDLLVVIEPAMTETAQLADYVLPTPTGYEKWEWSLFPKGFPEVYAQLRHPVVPLQGEGLPEAEIYHRLALASGIVKPAPRALRLLTRRVSPRAAATPFLGMVMTLAKRSGRSANQIFWIYELLGPHLPAKPLAAIWALCHLVVRTRRKDVERGTGLTGSDTAVAEALFDRIVEHPEGVVVGRVDPTRNLEENLRHPDGRMKLAHGPMLAEMARALTDPMDPPAERPLILQAGRRTRWTANSIHRDPAWRKGRASKCVLYMHPTDATELGLEDGAAVRVESVTSTADAELSLDETQRPGHVSLPNGFGMALQDKDGQTRRIGVRINELTASHARDPFTGIPYHKWVPVRVCAV
jgi:anaerobic selenocysteine-containing dehydrogenase